MGYNQIYLVNHQYHISKDILKAVMNQGISKTH